MVSQVSKKWLQRLTLICTLIFITSLVGCFESENSDSEKDKSDKANVNEKHTPSQGQSKIKPKIPLPEGVKFGMSLEEALNLDLCDLKKKPYDAKNDVVVLACPEFPVEFEYDLGEKITMDSPTVGSLYFINSKLRKIDILFSKAVQHWMPLSKSIITIRGNPKMAPNKSKIQKFNAGVITRLIHGWDDGNKLVYNVVSKYGGITTVTLWFHAVDFDAKELD